jgi:DNA-binding transcriptional regulator/RsmH inhibitor MraZ
VVLCTGWNKLAQDTVNWQAYANRSDNEASGSVDKEECIDQMSSNVKKIEADQDGRCYISKEQENTIIFDPKIII